MIWTIMAYWIINYSFFSISFRYDPVSNRPMVKIEYNNDQVFNRVIKQEVIDVTDHNNDQLLTG